MRTALLLLAQCCRQDRWSRFVRCLLLMLPMFFFDALQAQMPQPNDIVRFRLLDGYLILVQTRIDGVGPFNFLLDTGTTRTVIDSYLARRLHAPAIGEVSLTGVLHVRRDQLVQLDDVRLGQASLSRLGVAVDTLTRQKILAPGIRGVLGEDFLSKFDILIDYKRRRLCFGAPTPAGERWRFETIGQYQGSPTTNRLLITAEFVEASRAKVQLQLDTGAKIPELFPIKHDSHSSQPWGGSMTPSSDVNGATVYSDLTIKIGTTIIRHTDVVQSRRAIAFDAAGLLPAAIFRRIYISHSGGFVVLNPPE